MTPETNRRTIVVGYDGSAAALAAVKHAIDRVAQDGHLVVVHAYLTPTDHIGVALLHRDGGGRLAVRQQPSSTASSRTASASPRSSTRTTWRSGPPPPRSSEPPRHTRPPRSSSGAAASVACVRCWAASPTTSSTARTVPSPSSPSAWRTGRRQGLSRRQAPSERAPQPCRASRRGLRHGPRRSDRRAPPRVVVRGRLRSGWHDPRSWPPRRPLPRSRDAPLGRATSRRRCGSSCGRRPAARRSSSPRRSPRSCG